MMMMHNDDHDDDNYDDDKNHENDVDDNYDEDDDDEDDDRVRIGWAGGLVGGGRLLKWGGREGNTDPKLLQCQNFVMTKMTTLMILMRERSALDKKTFRD